MINNRYNNDDKHATQMGLTANTTTFFFVWDIASIYLNVQICIFYLYNVLMPRITFLVFHYTNKLQ